MNFVDIFVRRRVLAYMLSAAIILFGLIGLRDIGLDRMPNVSPPVVTITTVNPGASPEIMDSSITSVIEASVNSISAIDYVRSRSVPSVSQVRVAFELSKHANVAFNEVQAKVNQVINDLPEEAETPIVAKIKHERYSRLLPRITRNFRRLVRPNYQRRRRLQHAARAIP